MSSRRSSPVAAWTILEVEVVDEDEDAGSGVGSADADGVEPAAVAQGDLSADIDAVAAEAVVGWGFLVGGGGFGAGLVDGGWGCPVWE